MKTSLPATRSVILGLLLALPLAARATEPQLSALEQQFRELPMDAKRLTGPLFWLHGDETKERLESYLDRVAESGNGTFTAESRPHSDWLGEGWYRDLGICLESARRLNLTMWIFDEKWWPSQGIGGKVPPRYAAKKLQAEPTNLVGPRVLEMEGFGGEHYVAALAGQVTSDGKIEGKSLLDLATFVHDGRLRWSAPAGSWRVMKFTHTLAPGLGQQGGRQLSVDGASRDCVEWFLQTVYQPHYDRFKKDFGKTIRGFFYDEPETRGDWGTELNRVLDEWGIDWKRAYVAHKFELAGEEQAAARYQYLDALAEAWGRTMYGGMTRWCHDHGVKSIGHFMEHGNLYLHSDFCAGDMMRLQRYSDMGALDAVFTQFIMGQREARNPPVWQTPKLASSISHVFAKPDDVTMVEIFGARGQDLTYPEMKWWTDHMQVSGVNFTIPHSFNPRAPYDRDCPPYFYNGGYEPRYPLYRVYADYSSRLSLMLTGGRHVCPIALLFGGQSRQVGRMLTPEVITTAIQDAMYDCDWLPFDVFDRDATLVGRDVTLHHERYRVLIVPPVEVIPYATLAKAKRFFDAGGIVVGYGFLPSKSATLGKTTADIGLLREAIWGAASQSSLQAIKTNSAGGRSYLLAETPSPEQLTHALRDAGVPPVLDVLAGDTSGWLHVLHRQKAGQDVFLLCNQQHQGPAREFRFRAHASGVPECWDALRGEVCALACNRAGDHQVEFALTLQPLESALVVFQPQTLPRPARIEANTKPSAPPILVQRLASVADQPPPPHKSPKLTLSPARADPFVGQCVVPAAWLDGRSRICLECDDVRPEGAAAIRVNGQYVGGFIGRPYRLDVTHALKPGENRLEMHPFAPASVRLVSYPGSGPAAGKP